jgi:all-trans-retinol dehydrogenase (NAD+)
MICDVYDREDVYSKADKLVKEFGAVDILINNAGIVSKKEAKDGLAFLGMGDDKIVKIMNINGLSLFWICKAFLPSIIERSSGHIVTISSAAGIIGVNGLMDYCVSKFAAFGFGESIRMELRSMKNKVRTTVVCPFFIDTGMFHRVKICFSLVLPILKSSYATRKIVSAVLKNKRRLIMPLFVFSVYLLRLLPVKFLDWAADFFGINHSYG